MLFAAAVGLSSDLHLEIMPVARPMKCCEFNALPETLGEPARG
jgi:hypothetical protein